MVQIQVVPLSLSVRPCRLMVCGAFFHGVDDFGDVFEGRQDDSNQIAKLILWILDFIDILDKIYKVFIDLVQINLIGIKYRFVPFDV